METDRMQQWLASFISEQSEQYDAMVTNFLRVDATSTDGTSEGRTWTGVDRKFQCFKEAFFEQFANAFGQFLASWTECDHGHAEQVHTHPTRDRPPLNISDLISEAEDSGASASMAQSALSRGRVSAVEAAPGMTSESENDNESGESADSSSAAHYSTSPSEVDGGETEALAKEPGPRALPDSTHVAHGEVGGIAYPRDPRQTRPPRPDEKQAAEDREVPAPARRPLPSEALPSGALPSGTPISHKRRAPSAPGSRPTRAMKMIKSLVAQNRARVEASVATGSMPGQSPALLLSALRSREAVRQFCTLVNSRRAPENSFRFRSDQDQVQRLVDWLGSATNESTYAKFMLRFGLSQLAARIEASKAGAIRADAHVCRRVRESMGWSKDQWDDKLGKGRKWNRLCGQYDGLLCFLFLSKDNGLDIHPNMYISIDDKHLAAFHTLLNDDLLNDDYIKSICKAGRAFQDSLLGADVEFRWETSPQLDLTSLPEADLLSYLQPRLPISENLYRPGEYPCWDRPTGWSEDWPWPANPTSEGVSGCDLCDKVSCDCTTQPPRFLPRIKRYGEKGLGLQAVGETHGTIAYREHEIIGWLFGEIVPVETVVDDMTLEFVRPDLPEEPVVCRLDCREFSNYFRLLNYECHPSARLMQKKVSGRYVVAVVAAENIYDGRQITVSCGLKQGECLCETCTS